MSTPQDLATQLSQERYALSSLLEFARTLTPDLGPRGIIRSVLRTVMGRSLIKEAFAYLQDTASGGFELVNIAGFSSEALRPFLSYRDFDSLLGNGPDSGSQLNRGRAKLVPFASADGKSYLGLLGLGPSINPNLRDETEATYLASLAALTSIALTNAWLFERETERERLESELRLARDIQQSLLPQRFPEIVGAEFAAVSRPSEWVGGDYYDIISLGDDVVLLCIADVVGKGIAAALTMSNMQAALRALVGILRGGHLNLLDVVKELNRLMCESTAPDRFITAVIGVLDVKHRKFECVVCGHPNPAIGFENDEIIHVESTGIPLGIVPTFPYEAKTYSLQKGALLLFYTDGLSEARYGQSMVGSKGIEEVLLHPAMREGDLRDALLQLVDSPNIIVEDDITVLAVRFQATQ